MREPITLPRNPSASFKALNPSLYGAQPKTKDAEVVRTAAPGSHLEERFAELWGAAAVLADGVQPEREWRFATPRRWRFDFAFPAQKIAVEVEGGAYQTGRHQRPKGFLADCEKYFEAAIRGWTLVRLSSTMITDANIRKIAELVASKKRELGG